MKETYRSKISLKLVIPAAILIVGIFILMLIQGPWLPVLIVGLIPAFVIHLLITTYYTIDGSELYVRSGFIVNIKIDINTITKITPTNSILSAPALSFDRLEIFYNKFDSVVISPGDNAKFIAQLKAINPAIATT